MYSRLLMFVTICSICFSCVKKDEEININYLLEEMINRDEIAKFPKYDFRLQQQSSYNRISISPDDSVAWFTNHDFNSNKKDTNFVRIEERNGKKEWVLMEHEGPGVIVRSWMPFKSSKNPNTNSIINFYFDGENEPRLSGNMLSLLDGTGLFPYPFAHQSLRSAISFFPLAYAKSCKITVTERPFFFQFTYREYREGTPITTFSQEELKNSAAKIKGVGKVLISPTETETQEKLQLSSSLAENEEQELRLPKGCKAVNEISIKIKDLTDPSTTRKVILKMKCDGKETIWCPIGDLFGTGIGLNPYEGWHNSVCDDGTLTCRWIMPYQNTSTISLHNVGEDEIEFKLEISVKGWTWDARSMYFHAGFHQEYPISTRPYSDWNYVTLSGRGVYVGDALTVMNPIGKWWGEGDEKIWVDGEDFPSIFGTGTEDYYGYSWGGISTDFYQHPFHAQPRSNVYNKLKRKTTTERNTFGYSTETRTRGLDAMPFASSLQLDMEIWHWEKCDMGFGVGVMWYGDIDTQSNHIADPKGALNLPIIPKINKQ